MAVILALALPVLLGCIGLGVDFATLNLKRSTLQAAADAAAVAGAKQLSLASSTDAAVAATVQNYLKSELDGDDANATGAAKVDRTNSKVEVQVTENWTPFFAHFVDGSITPVITSATAVLQGETRLCILALNPSESQTYQTSELAHVQAPSCGVYSNSVDPKGMDLQGLSSITAQVICTAGGISANKSQTSVDPQTDCPVMADPLATRAPPVVGSCTQNSAKVTLGIATLYPGVYCGGLEISGVSIVNFKPGTYVIKDGPLKIGGAAIVTGKNVGFYLTGTNAALNLTGTSVIALSGAESGDMAGLLVYADRNQSDGLEHRINSPTVQELTGTIYLPKGNIRIDPITNVTVGAQSAYTAIVAERVRVANLPTLVMNTNYGATSVPVPDGIRSAATIVLSN